MATVSFSTIGPTPIELPLRQFDADEYIAMATAGVFEQRRRVELIGGYIVDMSPAGPDHNFVIIRLPRIFAPLMDQFDVSVQGTLRVDKRHVFDPDFMLLKARGKHYQKNLPAPGDVKLLIEVAASSLGRDAEVKSPIYAASGIPEYWIIDVDRDLLLVNRSPSGSEYLDKQELAGAAAISPLSAPDFSVTIAYILGDEPPA
jgi:Uma2 family endonuclease